MRDVLVLCYHAVSERWPADLAVTPARFEEQLALLRRRGYRGATFYDAVTNPPAERTVAVTFDDGYRSVLERGAPILASYGMPATVFVPTRFVGVDAPMSWPAIDAWRDGPHRDELKPLAWDQLGALAERGWEVGSHTRTHPVLPELDDGALVEELEGSRADCSTALGAECRTLAYPFGAEDERVVGAAERAGYAAAAALPHPLLTGPSRYRWPRIGVSRSDGLEVFERKISRPLRRLRRMRAWRLVQARHRLRGR